MIKRIITPEQLEAQKQWRKERAKQQREWFKSLTPEEREQRKQSIKEQRIYAAYDKQQRKEERERNKLNKRELRILKFMKKQNTQYHHHGTTSSMMKEIEERIKSFETRPYHKEYDPYIWNYQGEGNSYMPKSQLGRIWRSNEFNSIYDVPLDGTYRFYSYDSGQRGLGSFDYISAEKVEKQIKVPHVNPGALIPITC